MANAIQVRAGVTPTSIIPTDIDQVDRIATIACKSGLFKLNERRWQKDDNRDDDSGDDLTVRTKAACMMVIMQGIDVGVPPMQAIQGIAIINGRCLIWGDLVPAILWANGFKLREWTDGSGDDRVWHCAVTRPDGTVIERTFSVAEARQAGLWDTRPKIKKWKWGKERGKKDEWEADNDSPWYRFPERMGLMRARGFATKDGASDVLRGLGIREELDPALNPTTEPEPDATAPLDA
jgi:hypothetical protein